MNKRGANKILRALREEGGNLTYEEKRIKSHHWLSQTAACAKRFLGEDSDEYKALAHSSFWYNPQWTFNVNVEHFNSQKEEALRNLDHCIQAIETFGLYKAPKGNILSQISDGWLGVIFGLGLPALGFVAYTLGQVSAGNENRDLKREVRAVRDSLRTVTTRYEQAQREAAERRKEDEQRDQNTIH